MIEQEDAPTWAVLSDVVKAATYRPGWRIGLAHVKRGDEEGLRLDVISVGYDTYHPDRGETYRVQHSFIVPAPSYNRQSWTRWLFDRFVDIETHEACEFFVLGARRPFAPNHGPGHDPYTLRELNTVEAAETTFRGERREGTQAQS